MAIREQKGRKRPFFVYWTNPFTGKRESKSCKTRADAEKLDAYIKYQLQYERESFRRSEADESKSHTDHTLESIFYLYLKDRNFALRNLKLTLYGAKFILVSYGNIEIENISTSILTEMKERLVHSGIKGTSVRRRMSMIYAALRWALNNGYLESLPKFPKMPQAHNARIVPPTQEEVSRIYAVAPGYLRRVIILGFFFGIRVGQSELFKLKWTDVDLIGKVIRVPNAKKGATEPWRDVPIREDLVSLIEEWLREDLESSQEYLVSYRGRQVYSIYKGWRKALKQAGIHRNIRPYDLRHSFATEAIAAGSDFGTVAALMGHRSPMMVMKHYQHVKTVQKKTAVESLPPPPLCVQTDVCKNQGGAAHHSNILKS